MNERARSVSCRSEKAEVINFACFGLCGKKLFIVLVSFAQVTMMTNALRVVRITFLMLELHHSDGDKL